MIKVTAARVRSLVTECKTEMEIAHVLRSHKIRYTFTTETGTLTIRIPCHKGCVRVYRTCSRSAPFMVQGTKSTMVFPVPVLHAD